MAIEKPHYKLIETYKKIELREYDPYITAQVSVSAKNHREAVSQGFGALADFIFGNNTTAEKISMTAPVAAQEKSEKIAMTAPVTVTGEDIFTVAFSMPNRYTMDTLPKPNNERIQIIQNPKRMMAAIQFSGVFQQSNFDKHIQILRDWIEKSSLTEAGSPIVAGYNPPIVPWFLKHNEILIEVEDASKKNQ